MAKNPADRRRLYKRISLLLAGIVAGLVLIAYLAGLAVAAGLALTAAGQALWGRITQFFAGSILGALILGRKRDRCRHCNKPLTDQEGILVDKDDNYECSDNPGGDHHELKRRRES